MYNKISKNSSTFWRVFATCKITNYWRKSHQLPARLEDNKRRRRGQSIRDTKFGKIFFGKLSCKIRVFFEQISRKIRAFCSLFIHTFSGKKCLSPKLTELLYALELVRRPTCSIFSDRNVHTYFTLWSTYAYPRALAFHHKTQDMVFRSEDAISQNIEV